MGCGGERFQEGNGRIIVADHPVQALHPDPVSCDIRSHRKGSRKRRKREPDGMFSARMYVAFQVSRITKTGKKHGAQSEDKPEDAARGRSSCEREREQLIA